MKEINLLKIRREILEKKIGLIKRAEIVAFLLLVFYCLVVAGIFSFWLISRKQNEQVLSKIKFQKERVRKLEQVESLHTFLKQRLSALAPLFAEETMDYKETISRLDNLAPEGIVLDKIELSQKGKLDFGGTAANAVVLADFLERLLSSGSDEFAKNVKLSSATRQEDGSYLFNLSLDVKI